MSLKKLAQTLTNDPKNGYEMIDLTRSILDQWIDLGFKYPIDILEPFVSIDSQTDHVCGKMIYPLIGKPWGMVSGSIEEKKEIEELFVFFKPFYEDSRSKLLAYILNNFDEDVDQAIS
jgi:hypothetical protein